ncbi:MAG: dicarboxylate/amino acid:cation symporter, partial [Treponema sp.]|nr:dicarboxylate/amino acid:cation symporter [Treponema sp.]
LAFVIYPLIIRLLCGERHPFRVIYASAAPIMAAFISGESNMTLPLLIRHGNESLGIRHRVNGVTFPLFSIFARGGAALVTSVYFIVILKSYSMLEIKMAPVIWIGFWSFLLSFLLGEHPSGGTFLLLTVLCIKYGGGYEAGYLLLRDAAPVLGCFAAAFDALTAMAGSYIVAARTDSIERQELKKFI